MKLGSWLYVARATGVSRLSLSSGFFPLGSEKNTFVDVVQVAVVRLFKDPVLHRCYHGVSRQGAIVPGYHSTFRVFFSDLFSPMPCIYRELSTVRDREQLGSGYFSLALKKHLASVMTEAVVKIQRQGC